MIIVYGMKFLHFAFAGAWFGRLHNRETLSAPQKTSLSGTVNCIVGDHKFPLCEDDIRKYPSSMLTQLVEATKSGNDVRVDRSGHLFKYIYAFLVNGHLPRDPEGNIALASSTIKSLTAEAAFYGLPELVNEFKATKKVTSEPSVEDYYSLRNYFHNVSGDTLDIDYSSELICALRNVTTPFGMSGTYKYELQYDLLVGNSTVHKLNITELIAAADEKDNADKLVYNIGFNSDYDSYYDSDCNSDEDEDDEDADDEYDEQKVDLYAVERITEGIPYADLAPHQKLDLSSAGTLVVQQNGFAHDFIPVLNDSHNSDSIGKLVIILNSTYTGGELEVTHGGRTEVVTGPYRWVAMYGDCLHKINPVTSGTRVSLIYDIYSYREKKKDYLLGYLDIYDCLEPSHAGHTKRVDVTDVAKARLHKCLTSEFENWDTILIGLENLYTNYPTQPTSLRSSDKVLYDVLTASAQFEVAVVAVNVCHCRDKLCYFHDDYDVDDDVGKVGWTLYSPEFVHNSTLRNERKLGRAKLVVPAPFNTAGLIEYHEHMEYEQDETTTYVQSALQVRRKKKDKEDN